MINCFRILIEKFCYMHAHFSELLFLICLMLFAPKWTKVWLTHAFSRANPIFMAVLTFWELLKDCVFCVNILLYFIVLCCRWRRDSWVRNVSPSVIKSWLETYSTLEGRISGFGCPLQRTLDSSQSGPFTMTWTVASQWEQMLPGCTFLFCLKWTKN